MTWGTRRKLYHPRQGSAGAPQIHNVWGRMVVSFMTDEDHSIGNGKKAEESPMMIAMLTRIQGMTVVT
jgi:hypothetical protein